MLFFSYLVIQPTFIW